MCLVEDNDAVLDEFVVESEHKTVKEVDVGHCDQIGCLFDIMRVVERAKFSLPPNFPHRIHVDHSILENASRYPLRLLHVAKVVAHLLLFLLGELLLVTTHRFPVELLHRPHCLTTGFDELLSLQLLEVFLNAELIPRTEHCHIWAIAGLLEF